MLLPKNKLTFFEVLISEALTDLCINHGEFVAVNNVLREYNEMKEESKTPENALEIYYVKTMETYYVSCEKNTMNRNFSVRTTKQNRLMLVRNYAVCGKNKSRFIKNQEASRLKLH